MLTVTINGLKSETALIKPFFKNNRTNLLLEGEVYGLRESKAFVTTGNVKNNDYGFCNNG